ncbi:unnamed protein product [Closterium sp. NIES-65]|nr:unnamed protein product [Closterium sp. NIES-65]
MSSAILDRFRRGQVQVLVASDAMTRGMDVEGVFNVVSYDAPVYPKTFVHRAGRTARAGRPGHCYTILRKQEVRHFKAVLGKVGCADCPQGKAPSHLMEGLREHYDAGECSAGKAPSHLMEGLREHYDAVMAGGVMRSAPPSLHPHPLSHTSLSSRLLPVPLSPSQTSSPAALERLKAVVGEEERRGK